MAILSATWSFETWFYVNRRDDISLQVFHKVCIICGPKVFCGALGNLRRDKNHKGLGFYRHHVLKSGIRRYYDKLDISFFCALYAHGFQK